MSASHSTRVAQSPGKGNGVPRPQPAALTVRPSAAGDLVPLCFFFDTVLRKDYFLRRGQLEEAWRACQINTFGGGVNEVQREIVAMLGLGMPRAPR